MKGVRSSFVIEKVVNKSFTVREKGKHTQNSILSSFTLALTEPSSVLLSPLLPSKDKGTNPSFLTLPP